MFAYMGTRNVDHPLPNIVYTAIWMPNIVWPYTIILQCGLRQPNERSYHWLDYCKVVRACRSFFSPMYSTAACVPELDYYTRLNSDPTCIGGTPCCSNVSFLYSHGNHGAICQTWWFQCLALVSTAIMVKEMVSYLVLSGGL